MAARAMWKGVINFGDVRVPVKMYSAIEDRNVQFRMLHRKDREPVKQAMVNPETEETVEYNETSRAYIAETGDMVLLDKSELDALEPEKSRDIEIISFLPTHEIDHRWYDRPYYLGPDNSSQDYFALADSLEYSGMEGLARWTMRNKEYIGALRLYQGYPMLMSLRHAEEVVPVEALQPPNGAPLDDKELAMARQLIGMLEAKFEPEKYRDEYRDRVLELIEAKAEGKLLKLKPVRRRERAEDVSKALRASLEAAQRSA